MGSERDLRWEGKWSLFRRGCQEQHPRPREQHVWRSWGEKLRRRKDKRTVDVSGWGQVPRTLKTALGGVAMFQEPREGTVPPFFLAF